MNFVALFWNFSNASISLINDGRQMGEQYVRSGRISDRYKRFLTSVGDEGLREGSLYEVNSFVGLN